MKDSDGIILGLQQDEVEAVVNYFREHRYVHIVGQQIARDTDAIKRMGFIFDRCKNALDSRTEHNKEHHGAER